MNHRMCGECWIEKKLSFDKETGEASFQVPCRFTAPGEAQGKHCCFCGFPTRLGIFVREVSPPQCMCAPEEK